MWYLKRKKGKGKAELTEAESRIVLTKGKRVGKIGMDWSKLQTFIYTMNWV